MRLIDIKSAVFAKRLFEQDIDQQLQDTASKIQQASVMDTGEQNAGMGPADFGQVPTPADIGGQSPLQQTNQPEMPPGAGVPGDDVQDELFTKKVDSAVLAAIKGHDYTSEWDLDEKHPLHPYRILTMPMDELQQLRTAGRNKASQKTLGGELGTYDDDELKFWQDLVSFVDKVIETKKSTEKEYTEQKQGKTAKFKQMKPSKNIKAGEYKPGAGKSTKKK